MKATAIATNPTRSIIPVPIVVVKHRLDGEHRRDQLLEFEANAPLIDPHRKRVYHFDESLDRLRREGFDRHPRPRELYSLIIDGGEHSYGVSGGTMPALYADLFHPLATFHDYDMYCGEFLSMAMEQEGDTIRTYLDPEGLRYVNHYGGHYVKGDGFTCAEERRFRIERKQANGPLGLDEIADGFAEYICGRPYDGLPIEMREGPNRIHLYPGKGICPVGFGTGNAKPAGVFDLVTYYDRSSRGVRIGRVETYEMDERNPAFGE